MKKNISNVTSLFLAVVLMITSVQLGVSKTSAETVKGSLATEVTGTWSYWDGSKDVVQTNAMLLDKLPTMKNKGIYRFTTDNYDNENGAFLTNGWSTSMSWNYSKGDGYGNAIYAIPMAYLATSNGMLLINPFVRTTADTGTYLMNQDNTGYLSDFCIGTGQTLANTKTDKESDWSTRVRMEESANESNYIDFTMTHGSPFLFCELGGTTTASITSKRNLPADIVYYNGSSAQNSSLIIIRKFDNGDDAAGLTNYDYYALYLPEGATTTISGTSIQNGSFNINFAGNDQSYFSFAWLCDTKGANDSKAKTIAEEYEKYAYNFITDTKATYNYDASTSTVTTEYQYSFDKKAESSADGTIMGVIPHQYKNMSGYTYLDQTSKSIRGTVKFLEGSNYKTVQTYTGILPGLGTIPDYDKDQVKNYVEDFMDEFGPTQTAVTKESYGANTYDSGKKLNRAVQVMLAAEAAGDTENAEKLLKGIEAELADWFTADGTDTDKYFYYDDEMGALFGFPQAYYTVDGMTDHAFHYGYFINAAAQVALRDKSFIEQYGNVINELIEDIATTTRNSSSSKYPYLRQFDIWEGHSWASGHGDFGDGNNQESSSEAINGWAGLILYGQATGNQELTEAGIYLYTTEVQSVYNYWFDIDDDVLSNQYKKTIGGMQHRYASMIWGGKYGYETWWTAEPLQTNGINILPNTAASFYLAKDKAYMKDFVEVARANENNYSGADKDENRWNEIYTAYIAMYDPEAAEEYFNESCDAEAGDSKAHAWYQVKYMQKAGTPDLTVTGDTPLSSVFVNDDEEKTYVVYNADDTDKTVTFSDGTIVEAKAGQMTEVSGGSQTVGKATYSIEHYIQTSDGTYILNEKEIKNAKIGSEVSATAKSYYGYELDESADGTKLNGEVLEDGSLVLALYYKQTEVQAVSPGADDSLYTKLGSYDGLDISYYLIRNDLGANIKLLDNNLTFYLEYSGEYSKSNTTGYMNNVETPGYVYTGVYKFSTTSLEPDSYTTLKVKSGEKLLTMIIKYGNPTTGPAIEDTEIELPTVADDQPTDVSGIVLGSPANNTILVTIHATDTQNEKGQTYNIYVNGNKVLSEVSAGTHSIGDVGAGKCTVKVTAVLGEKESTGVTASIKVSGEKKEESTNAPETTSEKIVQTTEEPSTGAVEEPSSNEETYNVESTKDYEETSKTDSFDNTTTVEYETKDKTDITIARAKVKKAEKKKSAKKIKITLKSQKDINKYQIQISKSKKFTKKNILAKKTVKKVKFKIVKSKFKNKKKLFVRARAIKVINNKTYYGNWSKTKRVKITK